MSTDKELVKTSQQSQGSSILELLICSLIYDPIRTYIISKFPNHPTYCTKSSQKSLLLAQAECQCKLYHLIKRPPQFGVILTVPHPKHNMRNTSAFKKMVVIRSNKNDNLKSTVYRFFELSKNCINNIERKRANSAA